MKPMRMSILGTLGLLLALVVSAHAQPASPARDKIRVGKAFAQAFTFTPMDVGVETGTWERVGLEVEISAFGGDARMQQALTSASIDFGLGSGPGLGFMAKGVPAKGVAAFAGPPRNLGLIVPAEGPIKGVKDLRGKKLGITTPGSLTDWLARELSRQQGWGPEGIMRVPLGGLSETLAAYKTRQIDGFLIAIEVAFDIEEKGAGKILLNFGDTVKDFHTHVIFARNEVIEKNPNVVRKFVKGWFDTIAYMKANRAHTVKIAAKTVGVSEQIIDKVYGSTMSMLSDDGVFNPAAVSVLKRSFVELGILDREPDSSILFTTAFVPVKR